MAENQGGFVRLVRKAVGLPTGNSSCCTPVPATVKEQSDNAPAAAGGCCSGASEPKAEASTCCGPAAAPKTEQNSCC